MKAAFILLCVMGRNSVGYGHGFMKSPRSRNLLAKEETVWWPQTEDDPLPETCPHCLNLGGSLARCGMVQDRNYDSPKNALGGPMPTKIQATYSQGQNIIIDVSLTAHHKGHFVFSACPIVYGEVAGQPCFDNYKLTFVEDLKYGANFDPNYPERAYLAPAGAGYVLNTSSSNSVMDFSFKMRLPPDLYGEIVLIQWYYLTANSCIHEGYDQYNWPDDWGVQLSADKCTQISTDGRGTPEQFWNCAEVEILKDANFQQQQQQQQQQTQQSKPTTEISTAFSVDAVSTAGTQNTEQSNHNKHGKTIVGYYPSWQWYDRAKLAKPQNMDFTKVQRVNFAFFQTNEAGDLWGTDSWADPNLLFGPYNWNPPANEKKYCSWDAPNTKACSNHIYEEGLIHLVHAAGAEIYPSLGGWTLSDPFPKMAANSGARKNFARNCVELIKEYDFDGIDIDWEYPGYEDHSGTPEDKQNFRLLLNDVRAALDSLEVETGKTYGLTAALPCGPRHLSNMDIRHTAETLSELNLMTYDFHGAWDKTTGVNAPLYYQGFGDEEFNVEACVENWIAGGGSRDKINIGLPFYGRSFEGATGLNQEHGGADKAIWGIDDGTPQFFNIMSKLPSMTQVWDEKTWTQYAFFESGGLVSFDNENAICAKTEFVQKHNLNGFIVWELTGDVMEDLSTPLLDVVNEKLMNPNMICGKPGDVVVSTPLDTASSTYASSSTSASVSSSSAVGSASALPNTLISDDASDSGQPILLFCGGRQNIVNAETLVLTFAYELHRPLEGVTESAAIRSLKRSMLKSVADKLSCSGSIGRSLRTTDANQQIVALESSLQDKPNNKSPCTIPINHAVPTVCHSMIGSMKAYFAEGTPSSTMAEARDVLLFFIRTTMASGAYESVEVRKVIYIEDLSVGVIHSNPPPNAQNVLVWEEEGNGNGSSVLTSILVVLGMIFLGLLGFLFISRRKRRRGSGRVPTQQPPPSLSEIDSIAQGVEENSVESVWQKALDAYGNVNTDSDIPDPHSATVTNSNPNYTIGDESKDSSASNDPEAEGFVFRPASTSTLTKNKALGSGAIEEGTALICKTTEESQRQEQEQLTDTVTVGIDDDEGEAKAKDKDVDVEEDDNHVSDEGDNDDQLEPC